MQLLTILTLIYTGILVLALAGSLVAILIYLHRIDEALDETRQALAEVERETQALSPQLDKLQQGIASAAQDLKQAQKSLRNAEGREQASEQYQKAGQIAEILPRRR